MCAGDDPLDKKCAENAGAVWINAINHPLAAKWNKAFFYASTFYPSHYLFMGSSDWVSENWVQKSLDAMEGKYDMVGKRDAYMCDYNTITGLKRVIHWPGYNDGIRDDEPIGVGRLLSEELMFRLNHAPFQNHLNNSLDRSMFERIGFVNGRIGLIEDDSMKSLSLSCNDWKNKHHFDAHWTGILPSTKIDEPRQWLKDNFPEALQL